MHGSIEEIHCEEGRNWKKAVSIYFDRLCSDKCDSKVESSEVSEGEAVISVGASESSENESGLEEFNTSEFLQPVFCAFWNYMVWKTILGTQTF